MGSPMATNLQKKGFQTTGFDLNPAAAANLVRAGGSFAHTIAEAAKGADFVFTMLPNSAEVREAILHGIAPVADSRTMIVDMSTIDPLTTDEIAEHLKGRRLAFVDAPIGRLASQAEKGECLFMVGASKADYDTLMPLLQAMGTTFHHCGDVGAGIRTKIVNNFLSVAACQLNAEAIVLATRLGLGVEKLIDVMNGTTAANGHLKVNFPIKVLAGDVEPGFQLDLAFKDLGIALATASKLQVPMAMGASAHECMQLARAKGLGKKDFSVLLDVWSEMANVKPPRLGNIDAAS